MGDTEPEYVLDHLGLGVRDIAASRGFFEQALAPLGFSIVMAFEDAVVAIGLPQMPQFWLHQSTSQAPVHVAFHAQKRDRVDEFYVAALAAGGTDNGAPGLRPQYHPNYHAAYALDPDS
jgi:catechol 2,3-dioxygenase-like lactoylglutathione lyase family enzyme